MILLSERDDPRERQEAIARELGDVTKKVNRLVDAIAGGDAAALKTKLRELERHVRRNCRKKRLRCDQCLGWRKPWSKNRLDEWRRLQRQSTEQGRAVLQRVLRGRIVFTPTGPAHV